MAEKLLCYDILSGAVIPLGSKQSMRALDDHPLGLYPMLSENEFIVYNEEQVTLRYLVQVNQQW